jgi:CYTH domain-containing protein
MIRPDTTKVRNIKIAEDKAYMTTKNKAGNSKHREAKWSIPQTLLLPVSLYL